MSNLKEGTNLHANNTPFADIEGQRAAKLKTKIVDHALAGRISYRTAERLIARYHLENE